METTFIVGINLLAAVPTTLHSVWFASYPSSKRLPVVAALESRTWYPKEFRCYSQEKDKNLNRQIFPLSPNNL